MKKLLTKLVVTLIKWLYKTNQKQLIQKDLKKMIKESYQQTIREEFEIEREIVKVKKGNIKYYIVYFKTNTGRTKVVLNRNIDKTEKYVKVLN